jgi:SAM-dependent methyltransferase
MTAIDHEDRGTPPSARFWDRIADRYARMPVADDAAYQRKLDTTRHYLRPHMAVLEFGCGTGSTALAHAPYVHSILATDISARMLEIARTKAAARRVANVTFRRTGIDDLEAAPESFDAILGMSILHLLDDRDAVIGKVHRLLKPGGCFVSSTACLGDFMRWFGLVAPVGRALGLLPRVRIFTERDLVAALTDRGFRIAELWRPGRRQAVFIVATKPA